MVLFRHSILIFFSIFLVSRLFAQYAGNEIFISRELPSDAKISALGGDLISVEAENSSQAQKNPALFQTQIHNKLSMSYLNYIADINGFSTSYGYKLSSKSLISASINYLDYGKFTETLNNGDKNGNEFSASDVAISLGYGLKYKKLHYGVQASFIQSQMYIVKANGAVLDFGTWYQDTSGLFSAAFVIRNVGKQFRSYTSPQNRENLPYEVLVGVTKKLRHAPFRLSFTLKDLQQFDLTFKDPNDPDVQVDITTGEINTQDFNFIDKAARHMLIGVEVLLMPGFNIRAGYNHRKKRELEQYNRGGLTGFSWGVAIGVKSFDLDFSRVTYHLGGKTTQFSLSMPLKNNKFSS